MRNTVFVADSIFGAPGKRAVLATGSRISTLLADEDIRSYTGPGVDVVDIGGVVYPGFTDAHSHPSLGADLMRGVDLSSVDSLDGLRCTLEAQRRRLRAGEWLLGWGLEYSLWSDGEPTSEVIDDLTTEVPIVLQLFDCHALLVNREASRVARIADMPTFPSGAHAVLDASGVPTGLILEEQAMDYVRAVIPRESETARIARLADLLMQMAASGLTGVHVMDALPGSADAYDALESAGSLPLRLKLYPWFTPSMSDAGTDPLTLGSAAGRLWSHHGVKLFLDGTIDNGTAWLGSPDELGESRASIWRDTDAFAAVVTELASAGIGTATHAIGDAAIAWAAETIGRARALYPDVTHRIEHLEVTTDAVIDAVRRSGSIASMQPTHCTHFVAADHTDNWSRRLGASRSRGAWRLGSIARSGIPLAMGSDFPIAPFAPLDIMADSRLRRRVGTTHTPIGPHEALSAREAIDAFTSGPARAAGTQTHEGRVAAGFLCDLTILEADIERASADDLPSVGVRATVVDGRLAYAGPRG
jgi:predicted amidohydrolase YtcJ